MYFIIT